jgi:acyl-CoA thioesterase FadM
MADFTLTLEQKIKNEWLDEYKHLNIQFYLKLFNDAWVNLLLKSGRTLDEDNIGVVASRVLMAYRSEVKVGEAIEIWSGFTGLESQYITVKQKLTVDGKTRATCDARLYAFNLTSRKQSQFTADFLETASKFRIAGAEDYFDENPE